MTKLTLEALRKLRAAKQDEMARREADGSSGTILIGMGTCGIAAGARETFDAFVRALAEHPTLKRVAIRQTGCMGLCYAEPTVEIAMPGMPTILYGRVKADVVPQIVEEHLLKGRLVNDRIFDKPAVDLMKPRKS